MTGIDINNGVIYDNFSDLKYALSSVAVQHCISTEPILAAALSMLKPTSEDFKRHVKKFVNPTGPITDAVAFRSLLFGALQVASTGTIWDSEKSLLRNV